MEFEERNGSSDGTASPPITIDCVGIDHEYHFCILEAALIYMDQCFAIDTHEYKTTVMIILVIYLVDLFSPVTLLFPMFCLLN